MNARAITLQQPWASLVTIGAKTIETRSWSTRYRGPLLVHAGKVRPNFSPLALREACYSHAVGVWEQHPNEPGGTLVCVDSSDLPLGAVVASCQLVDCVPIGRGLMPNPDLGRATSVTNREGDGGNLVSLWRWNDEADDWDVKHYSERAFGDFTPGRYAWLLGDVKATTERCPRCWGAGMLDAWTGGCPTCGGHGLTIGDGICDPVPMHGKQGLWTPKWGAPDG